MKIRNLTLLLVFCIFSHHTKSQINVVKINCPDSLGYITNQGNSRACDFYFYNESPDIFYVEDFSHKDFHNLIFNNQTKLISIAKLVTPTYIAKVHDFIYASNKGNVLLYYYILKDHHEEKLLAE